MLGNVIGFESIDQNNLRLMKKGQNLTHGFQPNDPDEILRDMVETWAAFTVGHDGDTPSPSTHA